MKGSLSLLVRACAAAAVALPHFPFSVDETRADQWYLAALSVSQAHQHTRGAGVVVAVVDSGVDASHPDVQRNVLRGTDIVQGGTGDGRADADGHGTAMAALVAGHGHGNGSGDGVLGIAPEAKVLPIRIHSPAHVGTTDDGAQAVEWATDQGAHVICDATGGGVTVDLLNAVRRAQRSDIVVVAAVGNRPDDSGVLAPAAFPGVVAVAATDRAGQHYPSSVTGPEVVLAAPGVDIVSASKNSGYRDGTGTSDATAIVAGAVALVRAKFPELSAEEVIHRLTATATDKGPPGRDEQYGFGVLNLVAALTADVPPLHGATSTPKPSTAVALPSPPGPGDGSRSTTPLVAVLLAFLLAAAGVGIAAARWRRNG